MVVIPDEMTVDVVGMVDYLRLHQVDWVDCLTPGQLKMMAELVSTDTLPVYISLNICLHVLLVSHVSLSLR